MHRDNFVVAVRPAGGGKSFREYGIDGVPDSGSERTRRINVPFNQEYEFMFKNMKRCRRLVKIDIDGDEVGQWVIPSCGLSAAEVVLERFIDSDKRFKVLHSDDGGVADPTNPENGIIMITVIDEQQPPPRPRCPTRPSLRKRGSSTLRGASGPVNYSNKQIPIRDMDTSCSAGASYDLSISNNTFDSNVATGEGSVSKQQFTSTMWRGDCGTPLLFTFVLNGVDKKPKVKTGFCVECGTKLEDCFKFCAFCGTKVTV